jgi:hypothetical protein
VLLLTSLLFYSTVVVVVSFDLLSNGQFNQRSDKAETTEQDQHILSNHLSCSLMIVYNVATHCLLDKTI